MIKEENMEQENDLSNNNEKKKHEAFISERTAPLIIGLSVAIFNIWWRNQKYNTFKEMLGLDLSNLHFYLYDITFPLLILNLGMYKSSLYKNRMVLYVLVNAALIILNVFVLMR